MKNQHKYSGTQKRLLFQLFLARSGMVNKPTNISANARDIKKVYVVCLRNLGHLNKTVITNPFPINVIGIITIMQVKAAIWILAVLVSHVRTILLYIFVFETGVVFPGSIELKFRDNGYVFGTAMNRDEFNDKHDFLPIWHFPVIRLKSLHTINKTNNDFLNWSCILKVITEWPYYKLQFFTAQVKNTLFPQSYFVNGRKIYSLIIVYLISCGNWKETLGEKVLKEIICLNYCVTYRIS